MAQIAWQTPFSEVTWKVLHAQPLQREVCALSACRAKFPSLWLMNYMAWIAWTNGVIDEDFLAPVVALSIGQLVPVCTPCVL